jgi:hypothetical protein
MNNTKYEGKYTTWEDAYQKVVQDLNRESNSTYLNKINSSEKFDFENQTYSYAYES